ncbi:MAG: zf-HC2 domain-containing protein [Pseudorhodobacter sp.]|nr:zf-HC2 domain-containing protein [Pseudorhodobacter sp.]
MLTCREVAERADDWLGQDLGPWQALQMRLHLAMCKGCSRFIEQMRVTRALTEAAAGIDDGAPADDSRINAILSRLHADKQTKG